MVTVLESRHLFPLGGCLVTAGTPYIRLCPQKDVFCGLLHCKWTEGDSRREEILRDIEKRV